MSLKDEFRKFIHPYDEEDEPEEYQEEERPERPRRDEERRSDDRRSKVVNINSAGQLKVVLMKPVKFDEDANTIADHLMEKRRWISALCRSCPVKVRTSWCRSFPGSFTGMSVAVLRRRRSVRCSLIWRHIPMSPPKNFCPAMCGKSCVCCRRYKQRYRLKRSRSLPGISPPWKLCSRQS